MKRNYGLIFILFILWSLLDPHVSLGQTDTDNSDTWSTATVTHIELD